MEQVVRKRVSWGPVTAILGSIVLLIGAQLVVGLIVNAVLTSMGWGETRITDWYVSGNRSQFILSALSATATVTILFFYLSKINAHPRDIGLVKPKWRDIVSILGGAAVYVVSYIVLVAVISNLFPALNTEQTQDLGFTASNDSNDLVLIFISLVVLPPLVEEIVVRGFMYTGLRSKLSFLVAAFVSSAIFGLAHLLGGEGGSTIWIAVIDTFVLGMVLAYLREKSGSLWPAIGLHALKNLTAFVFIFILKTV